jgi:hypothetical protein
MTHVVIVGEGQTEETFVRDVLVGPFAARGKYLYPRLIRTSASARGGGLTPGRVLGYLRNTLRERNDTYVTTFFDLYALHPDFPGQAEAASIHDPVLRSEMIESHFTREVVGLAGCREDRFFAHIQPHEFEALLFSRPEALIDAEPQWRPWLESLREIRAAFPTPEHINHQESPAARLKSLPVPRYNKVLHGPRIAGMIGLAEIGAECRHFGQWKMRLEALPPL